MRSPSAPYTSWCRCTRLLPANWPETTTAWKCWPSPITSTCSQARPDSMPALMLSGVTSGVSPLGPQLVTGFEQQKAHRGHREERRDHQREADQRGHIGGAEKPVAEAVDHVEERVAMRKPAPQHGQRVDRVEHARQHGQRQDDEV